MVAKLNIKYQKCSLDHEDLSQKYPLFKSTYEYLLKKHNKYELSVEQTLLEIDMSAANFYIKKKKGKGIPCYRQESEGSRIIFPIICIALFMSEDFVKVGQENE